jgi:hypothetical protein
MRKLRDNNNDRAKSSKSKDCGSCVTLWLSLPKSLSDIPVNWKSLVKLTTLTVSCILGVEFDHLQIKLLVSQ